ncbi:MAG: hypothetical protein M3198_17880 [Actinomycetota bacterium]|nr:hypothetical protein [Actinomycetota bacterium]
MSKAGGKGARSRIAEIEERLRPPLAWARAAAELDDMFRSGAVPDPLPEGFLRGRALMTSLSRALDAVGRGIAELYMPWLGKSFTRDAGTGVNVFTRQARVLLKALWPSYVPERELSDRIEAFPLETRIGPGAVDPVVEVLKIDYDLEANPTFIVRSVLDELVQVDEGLYLGKVLYRWGSSHHPIGFFSLEEDAAELA